MDEAIKQIGERLKGLREVLNIPAGRWLNFAKSVLTTISRLSREKPTLPCIDFQRFQSDTASTSTYCSSARNLA